ncbi:MAG: hypothetical protein EZS28_035839, partial [Streblomastix strix]
NLIEIKKNDFQIPDEEDDDEIEEQQDGKHKDEDEDKDQNESLKEKDDDDEETIEDIQEEDQDEEKEDDEKDEESQDDLNESTDQTGWKEIELDCDPIPDDVEAFNMILLILSLTVLSYGQDYKQGKIYYNDNEIDSNGYLYLEALKKGHDADTADKSVNIRDYQAVVNGTKSTDKKFLTIPEADFISLLAGKGAEELECNTVKVYYEVDFFALLGFAAKFYEKENIAPSFTYLLANAPTKRVYKNKPAEADSSWDDIKLIFSCDNNNFNYDFVSAVLQKYGVVSAACFSNNAIPATTDKCADTINNPKPLLKGYRLAAFTGDRETFKEVLLRFGPIYTEGVIVVGWDKQDEIEQVIYASKSSSFGEYNLHKDKFEEGTYDGYFYFNPDKPKKVELWRRIWMLLQIHKNALIKLIECLKQSS